MLLVLLALHANATPYGLGVDPWLPQPGARSLDIRRDALLDLGVPDTALDRDGCPLVTTAEICASEAFWATTCGARALVDSRTPQACHQAFSTYAQSVDSVLQRVVLVDVSTGEPVEVLFEDYNPSAITWDGLEASYGSHLLRLSQPRSNGDVLGAAIELTWWENNCSVQSCEEYAFEAFYDYSSFEARAAAALRDGDERAVFDLAYSADGIARRTLRSRAGKPLPYWQPSRGRDSYLSGYRRSDGASSRGPLYGLELGDIPAATSTNLIVPSYTVPAGARRDAIAIPHLVQATGVDVPLLNGTDLSAIGAALVDFDRSCDVDHDSGWLHCTDATAEQQAIADAFNTHLWSWNSAPMQDIPADQRWPEDGRDPWDTHQELSAALAHHTDERLIWLEDRQQELAGLMTQRRRLWTTLNTLAWVQSLPFGSCDPQTFPMACRDPEAELPEVLDELRAVDQRASALIQVFERAGCLGPAPTACDWSPRWFRHAALDQLIDEREAAFRTCIARTGNDFRALRPEPDDTDPYWLVAEQAALEPVVGGICESTSTREPAGECMILPNDSYRDYLVDDRTVDAYFATLDAWGEAFAERWDFPVDPDSGRPRIGGTASDRYELGSDDFGASLAYSAGWTLDAIDDLPAGLGVSAHGQLQIGAELFGRAIPTRYAGTDPSIPDRQFDARRAAGNLLFADLFVAGRDDSDAWAVFDLLGVELYHQTGTVAAEAAPLQFHFVDEVAYPFGELEELVFVGPVPVTLTAGAAGTVGSSTTASARLGSRGTALEASADGTFRPYARASVYASADAGIPEFLSIGISARLDLVEAALPVTSQVLARSDVQGDSLLEVDVRSDLELRLLQGRIDAQAKLPWDSYRTTLFRFSGIGHTTPLSRTTFAADLDAIARAFAGAPAAAPITRRDLPSSTLVEQRSGTCEPRSLPTPSLYVDFDDESIDGTTLAAVIGDASLDVSTALTSRPGRHGQAVQGAPLSVEGELDLGFSQTLALWFRPTGTSGVIAALGAEDHADAGVVVRQEGTRQLRIAIPCDGQRRDVLARLSDDPTWHHVAISLDRAAQQALVYVDNAFAGRVAQCRVVLDDDLHLGAQVSSNGTTSEPWQGEVDELGLWNDLALSALELSEIAQRGYAGLPLAGPGSAPLTSVRDLRGSLVSDGAGLRLDLTWTPPPSLSEPGHGFDDVVVRIDTEGFPHTVDAGIDGVVSTASSAVLFPPVSARKVFVATWARGPVGLRPGPRLEVTPAAANLRPIEDLVATARDGAVDLRWSLPGDPAVRSTIIARSSQPLQHPSEGAIVYDGRAEELRVDGLTNEVTAVFTAWSVDGFGRLAPPVSTAATPTAGAQSDDTPPGALQRLEIVVQADRASLRWENPVDPDPLQVVVRRVRRSVFREQLALLRGERFEDRGLVPDEPVRYELFAVDPAGNTGPVSVIEATPLHLDAPALLSATPGTHSIELHWPLGIGRPPQVQVVRDGSAADSVFDGVAVCQSNTGTCIDANPPSDAYVVYTAFVVRDDASSAGTASPRVRLETPTDFAGPDREVFVGERVELEAVGLDTVLGWTANLPLVVDGEHHWFVAKEPGAHTISVSGLFRGAPVTDDLTITVLPHDGDATGPTTNPFAPVLLGDDPVLALFADPLGAIAALGGPDIARVHGNSVTRTRLNACSTLRAVSDGLALCGDDSQPFRAYDLDDGSATWTAPGPQGTVLVALRDGVMAHVDGGTHLHPEVDLAFVDTTEHSPLGTLRLNGAAGPPTALALDNGGNHLAALWWRELHLFPASGIAGTVDAYPSASATADGLGYLDLAWNDDQLVALVDKGLDLVELHAYDTASGALVPSWQVAVQPGAHAVTWDGGWLVRTNGDVTQYDSSGQAQARFTGTSAALHAAAGDAGHVYVASGAAGLLVHPRTNPLSTAAPTPLFPPSDIGFGLLDGVHTDRGAWAARTYEQLAVGIGDELLATHLTGFSAAPYDVSRVACVHADTVHFVQDLAGAPQWTARDLRDPQHAPRDPWALPSCQAAACLGEHLVLLCDDTVRAYTHAGSLVDSAPLPVGGAFRTLQAAGEGVLVVDDDFSTVHLTAVHLSDGSLSLSTEVSATGYQPGGALSNGALIYSDGWSSWWLDLLAEATTPRPARHPGYLFTTDDRVGQLIAVGDDLLTAWEGEALRAQAPVDKPMWVSADSGQVVVASGGTAHLAQTAPLRLLAQAHRVEPDSDLITEVDLGQDLVGVQVSCIVDRGDCTVQHVDLQRGVATVAWTAPTAGDAVLTVLAGTHQWFRSAVDRVTVETP